MSAALTRPQFLVTDPAILMQEMVVDFETTTGRVLQPAQVEQLLINFIAYRETLVRLDVQHAAEQNLVAFADGQNLDNLAADLGVTRLVAVHAVATMRFSLAGVLGTATIIPAGTRIRTTDGLQIFQTNAEGKILVGLLYNDLPVTCTVGGLQGNGYLAGSIAEILDPIVGVTTMVNTTTSHGGIDTEDDERLRLRVQLSPTAFGTAGAEEAYRYWALTFGLEILDAVVTSPAGGEIQVAILTVSGAPSTQQITDLLAYLSAQTRRPLTDTVSVVGANALDYTIQAALTIYDTFDGPTVLAAANAAAQALSLDRLRNLGKDLTPTQVTNALSVPGVYDLVLTHPATAIIATPADYCNCTGITLTIAGTTHG